MAIFLENISIISAAPPGPKALLVFVTLIFLKTISAARMS